MRRMETSPLLEVLPVLVLVPALAFAEQNHPTLNANANLTSTAPSEWIVGTRLWVAVIIENARDTVIHGPLLESRPFSFASYSYALHRRADGQVVAKHECRQQPFKPASDMLIGPDGREAGSGVELRPHHMIAAKGALRLLFPVDWPTAAAIGPGDYDLEMTICGVIGVMGPSASTAVKIRKPSEAESEVLTAILPGGPVQERGPSKELDQLVLPGSLKANGLGFEMLLYRLYAKREPLEKTNEAQLGEGLLPMFNPEVSVIKYEVLKAKGLNDQAAGLRKHVIEENPGTAFRFGSADSGHGIVAGKPVTGK